MNKIIIYLIKFYKYAISPYTPRSCRFDPSCSDYSIQAFEKYGLFKGGYKTIKRILKCNPWGPFGYDPLD